MLRLCVIGRVCFQTVAALPRVFQAPLSALAFRLLPGDDLTLSTIAAARASSVHAGCIVTCVGSLSCATLRMAGAEEIVRFEEELEIVGLVGTLGCGSGGQDSATHHLHLTASRRDGSVIAGHLKGPALIRTTAEVVLGELDELSFERGWDESTGYAELQISGLDDGLEYGL